MKILCNREKLQAAFQMAAAVAPSRNPKPILANIKIAADTDSAVVIATDMETGVRASVPDVQVKKAGAAILPVKRVASILNECSDEIIQIEASDRGITIKGDRSEFKLPVENPDEFPDIAVAKLDRYFEVKAGELRQLFQRTMFCIDEESSRYAMGGVLIEVSGRRMIGVGTDGRRLSKHEINSTGVNSPAEIESTGQTIIPAKALKQLVRILPSDDEIVQFTADGTNATFVMAGVTFRARLLEGRFPQWRMVLPHRPDASNIEMPIGGFWSVVRQAAIVASDDSRGLDIDFAGGQVQLAGRNASFGESKIEMPIAYDGPPQGITLDNCFVSDFCKVCDRESKFTCEIDGPDSAAVFREGSTEYVLMPLARDK